MNTQPVRTVAAFESACLIRCANLGTPFAPRRPSFGSGPAADAEAVAEFDQRAAAERLTSLLTGLGYAATSEVRAGGGVRRYEVHRVLVPEREQPAMRRAMTTVWERGRRLLDDDQHTRRITLSRTAWQAALLAGGSRRRAGTLRVCLGDPELAGILVRGTRLIGVPGEVTRRPGCIVVSVANASVPLLVTETDRPRLPALAS
jgi:hypothetical protein